LNHAPNSFPLPWRAPGLAFVTSPSPLAYHLITVTSSLTRPSPEPKRYPPVLPCCSSSSFRQPSLGLQNLPPVA